MVSFVSIMLALFWYFVGSFIGLFSADAIRNKQFFTVLSILSVIDYVTYLLLGSAVLTILPIVLSFFIIDIN